MDTAIQTCYRHPDRRAGVICQRCDRPICPDCMQQASVGFHCPACTKSSGQRVMRASQLRGTGMVVTNVLLALNIAIFVFGLGGDDSLLIDGGLIGTGRVDDGTPFGDLVGVSQGEWWRMLTSGFLHAGLLHVGFNMFVLYQLGQLLEPALGRLRYGLVYFVSMLCGSFGVLLLDPNALTVGASGAVFGMFGAAVAVFRSRGINVFDTGLGGAIVINLLITFTVPNISIGGHVGGLVGGFVAGYLLTDLGPRYLRDQRLALGGVVLLGLAAASAGILVV